jgi:hypothetical protein
VLVLQRSERAVGHGGERSPVGPCFHCGDALVDWKPGHTNWQIGDRLLAEEYFGVRQHV